MGEVERMLHGGELRLPYPEHYAGKRTWELAETIHYHERNLRLEYTADEFRAFAAAVSEAWERWVGLGMPLPEPGAATVYLSLTDVRPSPGVTPRRCEVEHSRYPTIPGGTIHLHYRNLRIEFSPAEWLQFLGAVEAAGRAWRV